MKLARYSGVDVVAVQGASDAAMPWRALTPVFRAADGAILWPVRFYPHEFLASETDEVELERGIVERGVKRLPEPIPARADFRLVEPEPGTFQYVSKVILLGRREATLRERLVHALASLSGSSDAAEIEDAFDAAYLVSPSNIVAATLRCGAAQRIGDAAWKAQTVADLVACSDHAGDMQAARSHPMWKRLPAARDELFRLARRAVDDWLAPEVDFLPPVDRLSQLKAAVLADLRLKGLRVPAGVRGRLVEALRGDPEAIASVERALDHVAEWRTALRELEEHESQVESRLMREARQAFAHAHLADLTRFARTLPSLEVAAGESNRTTRWRLFRATMAGTDRLVGGEPWQQGEALALDVRARLGLNGHAHECLAGFSSQTVGAFVAIADLPTSAAAVAPATAPPCIFVERALSGSDRSLARRFSIAHELAHLLFDRGTERSVGWTCRTSVDEAGDLHRGDPERRANAFAAYFIAPREAVRALVPRCPSPDEHDFVLAVMNVRRQFGLTSVAAAQHLLNCTLSERAGMRLPPEARARVRDAAAAEGEPTAFLEPIEVGEHGPASSRVRRGHFAELVAVAVRGGSVEVDDAARLLGTDTASVGEWLAANPAP